MKSTAATPLFDRENPPELRPLSSRTRAALRAEWLTAKAANDLATGRDIIQVAKAHDQAWPDEPSLYNEVTGRACKYELLDKAAA